MPSVPHINIKIVTHELNYDNAIGEWTARRRSDGIKWYLEEAYEYDDMDLNSREGRHIDGLPFYVLPVEDIGLTRSYCLDYINASCRFHDLIEEAEYHGSRGVCWANPSLIAEQEEIMGVLGARITEAVNERFDPWLRRRHLLAMLKRGKHLWFEEPTATAELAPVTTSTEPPWAGLY